VKSWIPENLNGVSIFTIPKPQIDSFKLFLEGTANDGSFISEEKIIKIP